MSFSVILAKRADQTGILSFYRFATREEAKAYQQYLRIHHGVDATSETGEPVNAAFRFETGKVELLF